MLLKTVDKLGLTTAKRGTEMDFTPCYSANAFDGTDIRNGNGELRGHTEKVRHGYVARLSDGLLATDRLGIFPDNDTAIFAIEKALAGL